MIVKILSSSATFSAVRYNTDKMQRGKGELIISSGFSPLSMLSEIKPADYINYLKMVSSINSRIFKPQFHAVISAKGNEHSKEYLAELGVKWMEKMGYGDNPYLIIFHNDTKNNHIHLVSTRVDKDGKKISSAFEKVRAVKFINELGRIDVLQEAKKELNLALSFSISTLAQFKLLLESKGYVIVENSGIIKVLKYGCMLTEISTDTVLKRVSQCKSDEQRLLQLKSIFSKYRSIWDTTLKPQRSGVSKFKSAFSENLLQKFGVEIIFHSKNNLQPYGYSIIDHPGKNVFKGSQAIKLSEIIAVSTQSDAHHVEKFQQKPDIRESKVDKASTDSYQDFISLKSLSVHLRFSLAEDIDDEAIHGRNRQRKGKARTNTR